MIYLPSSGVAPTQWNGEIDRDSKQATGLVAAFHPLLGWRDLIAGRNMTPVGNATAYGNNAQIGRTYTLDGTDDCAYVTLPETWKLQRFTVAAWIKPLATGNNHIFALVPRGAAADGRGISFALSNYLLYLAVGSGTAYTYSNTGATLTSGETYQVAATYDGANMVAYVNGKQDSIKAATVTISYTDKNTSTGPNPASAYIGGYHGSTNSGPAVTADILYEFNGQIGPVSLYNRALSAAEVWQLYDPQTRWQLYQPPRPMVWWIPFDDNSLSFSTGDSTSVGESVALSVSAAQIAVTDAASVAESASLKPQTQIAVTDAATVAESVSLAPQTQIAVAESATVAESASLTRSVAAIAVADAVTVAEAISVEVGAQAVIDVTASDATSVGESIGVALSAPAIAVGDGASVGESVSLVFGYIFTVESSGAGESGSFYPAAIAPGNVTLGGSITNQQGYIRFAAVTLPRYSQITYSFVAWADAVDDSTPETISISIYAEDAANPSAPTTFGQANGIDATSSSIYWTSLYRAQAADQWSNTPNIAAIIQELINSYDYSSGAAIVLYIYSNGYTASDGYTFHGSTTAYKPLLTVAYVTPVLAIETADAAIVGESLALTVTLPDIAIATADASTVAEAVSLAPLTQIAAADASTVAEAVSLAPLTQIATADASTVAEAVSLQPLTQIATADASTVAEAVSLAPLTQIATADASTVAEAASLQPLTQIAVADASTVAEAASLSIDAPAIVVADASTVGESISVVAEVIGVRQVTTSDGLTVSEAIGLIVSATAITVSDSATVIEQTTLAFVLSISTADASTVADTATLDRSVAAIATADASTVAEAASLQPLTQIAVADSATIGEAIGLPDISTSAIVATDSASVLDAFSAYPAQLLLQVADSAVAADAFSAYPAQLLLQSASAINISDLIVVLVQSLTGKIDVTLADSALYRATLADSALYRATLADSALYNAVVSDRTRTEGIG